MDISIDTSAVQTVIPEKPNAVRREFLTELPTPGHFLFILDNSAMEKWERCPTSLMYYLVYGREAHARNAALSFGSSIHLGAEQIGRAQGAVEDQLETAKRVVNFFAENPTPVDEYRTPTTALEVLAHYRVRCEMPDYQWEILRDREGALLVEIPFELPLGVLEVNAEIKLPNWPEPKFVSEVHVAWSGRIDKIVAVNGKTRIVDHKTTSIDGDQFVQSFQLASQTIGYVWAGQQLYPELDVSGFCLDAMRLKKPAIGAGLMDKGPRGGQPALQFFRAYFDYTTKRTNEWAANALAKTEDIVHCLVRGFFPMFTHHCFNKYGRCQYHDVDLLDNSETRIRMLTSDAYKEVTWDPTADR